MKSFIAILALLGVASATFYGLYPEQQHFWGPYRYPTGQTHLPWYNYKYGQTYNKGYPYSKYFHSYPHTTYPYGQEYVPEGIHGQYPVKDVTFFKHITSVPGFDKQYELPHYYPYGQEKLYSQFDKYAPFYMKYLPKTFEKFWPEYEKFMPTYGSQMPWFSKYMPGYEKFLPSFGKFVPEFEKFMPTWFQKYWPKYEKFDPEHIYPVEQTLETEVVVNTPGVHDVVYPTTYPTHTPYWNKFFGYKNIPYQYPTSQYYPKYFEQRPFHYGLHY